MRKKNILLCDFCISLKLYGWLPTTKSEKVYFCYKQDDNFTVISTGYRKRMRVGICEKRNILPRDAEMNPQCRKLKKKVLDAITLICFWNPPHTGLYSLRIPFTVLWDRREIPLQSTHSFANTMHDCTFTKRTLCNQSEATGSHWPAMLILFTSTLAQGVMGWIAIACRCLIQTTFAHLCVCSSVWGSPRNAC